MRDFCLSCCSTADLNEGRFNEMGISYIPFHYTLGDNEYADDCGKTIKPKELYERMLSGEDSKTSQVTVAEYISYFERIIKSGHDVLHVCLSSGISGSYNSACVARDELKYEYPDSKIYVIDSLAASSGYGLLVDKMYELKSGGMDIDELYNWTEENKTRLHHWFFTSDLTFFIKGGRVTKTAGFVGNLLNICPMLNVDFEGHLIPREKIRGKHKAIKRAVELMEQHAEGGLDYADKVYISNSECFDDARKEADLIEEKFKKLKGKVEIYDIGAVIGSHTGPGTVALFFWGDKRVD
ncbi:MAG: DegV family protein [Lachnospiraceae bacterium]|nr:DegV family protein [Lachnospiraceae bacterium]